MGGDEVQVAAGMPPISHGQRPLSYFEFWPLWLMYLPVVLQWLALALRYRSLTLPLIANPSLPLSGMVGLGKHEIFRQATGSCAASILPWVLYDVDERPARVQAAQLVEMAGARGIAFPFVCKPDIGCRGSGVRLVQTGADLEACLAAYPAGARLLAQRLATWEPEAGIFYIRRPGDSTGRIVSLALKYSPYVVGDGSHTLRELIARDRRAGRVTHLYRERFRDRLDEVPAAGERIRLVFSISHCRGAIFRNGAEHITPDLSARIDALMRDIPEFYYGRLDVKFRDTGSLMLGRSLEIVEINAASSESLHIWDRNAGLREAVSALASQYRALFEIGAMNRGRGMRPPGLGELLRRWRIERRLVRQYPATD